MAATLVLSDAEGLRRFFTELPLPVDHVLVGGGGPVYAPILEMDFDQARSVLDEHVPGSLRIAGSVRAVSGPAEITDEITGTHARRPGVA